MERVLLADVGGTYLRYRIGNETVVQVGVDGWEERLMGILSEQPQIEQVGIAFAGQVSEGKIRSAPNVTVSCPDITTLLEERFPHLRVAVENDLKCAALAYARHLRSDSLAVLYAGSGLGSALISEGRLVRGKGNMAGEIGHVSYKKAPFSCGCGKTDCLELYASGSGIEKHRRHLGLTALSPDGWLREGSSAERQTAEEAAEALSFAASLLITLHNPEYLLLGGGVLEHNPKLRSLIKERIPQRTFPPAWKGCGIVDADIANAPLIGAGLLLQEEFRLQ